jgi:predicted ArsR family transcriptional regulator
MIEHTLPLDDETRYRLLRQLADNPELSQRELARQFGISVGKVNYCLKALLDKGYKSWKLQEQPQQTCLPLPAHTRRPRPRAGRPHAFWRANKRNTNASHGK